MSTLVSGKDREDEQLKASRPSTPEDVKRYIQKHNVQVVDFKFNDLPGLWQHFSIPAADLTEFDKLEKIFCNFWCIAVRFFSSL